MDAVTETPVAETPSAPVDAPAAEVESSLADHEAQYAPGRREGATDGDTERKPPHRAQSHRATAKDVEEIQAQTARLRQAEQDAGITAPERKPGESDRAFKIRREAELVEAVRDARKAAATVPAATPDSPRLEPPRAPRAPRAGLIPVPFDEPLPNAQDFASAADPATEYYRALARYEFRKDIHEAQQILSAHQAKQDAERAEQAHAEQMAQHAARVQATASAKPDFWAKLDEVEDIKIPDVLAHAIVGDDKSAELMYALAAQPNKLLEASLISTSLGMDEQSIAMLRRWMHSQVQGAGAIPSGAPAPARSVTVAPRPPTPLRTGPLQTGDEPPGDNDASIANHERYFAPKRR